MDNLTTSDKPDATAAPASPPPTSWLGVVSLSVGVFALVMAEFLPASLLSRISTDLGVTEGGAGQSVTVTAIVAAVAGLTIPVLLPRLNRRHLMLCLSVLSVLSSLLVAIAPNYPVLLAARVLLGIAAGGFWAIGISLTARLVSPAQLGRGLTVVNIGVSLATVAAIPLGTWLGEIWGWRIVFVLAAAVGVIAVIMQAIVLPSVRSSSSTGFRTLLATLRSGAILIGLLAMLSWWVGTSLASPTSGRPQSISVDSTRRSSRCSLWPTVWRRSSGTWPRALWPTSSCAWPYCSPLRRSARR